MPVLAESTTEDVAARGGTSDGGEATHDATEEVELPLSALGLPSLRANGLDPDHVARLAETADGWPPILVRRSDRSVIDGQHRVAAARTLGMRHVRAVFFDGSNDDAYFEFVRRNVGHGLPLSLDERRAAVHRIVRTHPDRSDRGIAALCGVSPKTVARVRQELGARGALVPVTTRVGRDGRARPIDPVGVRERILEELERDPEASLRCIAKKVGASPETVRTVRSRLCAGTMPAETDPRPAFDPDATVLALLTRRQRREASWRSDAALATGEGGEAFVSWFEATTVDDVDAWTYAPGVPLSRTYEVADEARRRATFWSSFAQAVERQVRRRA
jgi:ParB-like chromosome segregation protein Spo0J